MSHDDIDFTVSVNGHGSRECVRPTLRLLPLGKIVAVPHSSISPRWARMSSTQNAACSAACLPMVPMIEASSAILHTDLSFMDMVRAIVKGTLFVNHGFRGYDLKTLVVRCFFNCVAKYLAQELTNNLK